jgi:ketol-acid reductoisomerase
MTHSNRFALAVAALSLFGAATVRAQDAHKPGGLNKVAHDVSNTAKKAGRDTKAEVKRDEVKSHAKLQNAGNETKTAIKKTTGIKGSQADHPGGLNKVAREVSHAGKSVGRKARTKMNKAKSKTHAELTKEGKDAKESAKKP